MPNEEHCELIRQGADVWNAWRHKHPDIEYPDLSAAQLDFVDCRSADLRGANFFRARLRHADFRGSTLERTEFGRAQLVGAKFSGTTLQRCSFMRADLTNARFDDAQLDDVVFTQADMEGAELPSAKLVNAHMVYTKLRKANMAGVQIQGGKFQAVNFESANLESACISEADLSLSSMVGANLRGAALQDCRVFGMSVWRANLENATQRGLQVTAPEEPSVEVDDIEVAQFVYLMLHNPNIRKVIDTIGRKGVLILGRFTPERKHVLQELKSGLTKLGYVPFLFDFDRPADKSFSETVLTLAGMSLFVIADITNPSSSPLELQVTLPALNIPCVPIIQKGEEPFSMFKDLQSSFGSPDEGRMLDLLTYSSADVLVRVLKPAIVAPALDRSRVLAKRKAEPVHTRNADDFLDA